MQVIETGLDGVLQIVPQRHGDARGWFSETWNKAQWAEHGIDIEWVQDNESLSGEANTLRGIHFQRAPFAQDKLVRVLKGSIHDIAVDLRRSSPTFGLWVGVDLTAEAGNQLLVPAGFGHGFATLEPHCHVAYKVSAPYSREHDAAVAWNDPELGVEWPIDASDVILSDKDRQAPQVADAGDLLFD